MTYYAKKTTIYKPLFFFFCGWFPTCQVRAVRFYVSSSPPLLSSPLLSSSPSSPSSPLTFSSSWSFFSLLLSTVIPHCKCSVPDLNRDRPRPVFATGPQPRSFAPSVRCRTSTSRKNVRRDARRNVRQNVRKNVRRYARKYVRKTARRICQKECEKECQKICWNECQKECQTECQERCQKQSQKECQKICQKECQKICQQECQKIFYSQYVKFRVIGREVWQGTLGAYGRSTEGDEEARGRGGRSEQEEMRLT